MSDDGTTRVDLHVKILDEEVVARAKASGLDVIVYTPHFTHLSTARERAGRYTDDDLLVVPAREYFTGTWRDRKHVLAIDPEDPIPDFIGFDDTMAELAGQDAAVLAPHVEFLTVSLDREDVAEYRDVFDAIEVYNPKHLWWHNERAERVAEDIGLPAFASSYAHLRPTIGEVFVEFDATIESARELKDAIRSGQKASMYHRGGPVHELKCKAEFVHLILENTWEKFDRVVLGDTEATSPFHPEYGGRFEDRSAY